jgi:hypothetical protein
LTVEHQRRHTAELLTTASCAAADELIAVDSRLYRCLFTTGDRIRQQRHGQADVRVRDESSGQVINATLVGDMAFWSWGNHRSPPAHRLPQLRPNLRHPLLARTRLLL